MAIASAAAETGAQGITKQYGIMSAYNMLHTLMPGELIQTRIFIEKNIHPILWDPLIRTLLWFPAWLILGVPGGFFVWKFRDRSLEEEGEDDEFVNSTYDDILAAAEEYDEFDHEDEATPSKYGHLNDFDPTADHAADELGEFKRDPKKK